MRQNGMARVITVNKAKLIEQIKENKQNHVVEYAKAVEAYKKEAKKQLDKQLDELEKGSLSIKVNLIAPSDKTEEYDKILAMFDWEELDTVKLSQGEFNEYILDETSFALQAKMLNSTYLLNG